MEQGKGNAALPVFGLSLVMENSLSTKRSLMLTSQSWTIEPTFFVHLMLPRLWGFGM
jgi:hypothetical protein